MQQTGMRLVLGVVAGIAFGIAAADETATPTPAGASEVRAPELRAPFAARRVDADALAKQRGGTDPGTLSDMKLNGVVANNSASNLSTGSNAITDGAFAGVNGVPLVVQNSGNNVLIQSATIINVQVK